MANILHEWSVLDEEDINRIKLYIEKTGGKAYLFLLTKLKALGLDNLKGYEITTEIEKLKRLRADEALKFYYKLEKQAERGKNGKSTTNRQPFKAC